MIARPMSRAVFLLSIVNPTIDSQFASPRQLYRFSFNSLWDDDMNHMEIIWHILQKW